MRRSRAGDTVVRRVRNGETLCCQAAERGTSWFLHPSEKTVRAPAAEAAIASGRLIANGDGLFGASQTWRAAP